MTDITATTSRVEELRREALLKVRAEEYDQALSLYDDALAIATDDEARELLTINKADVLVALQQNGPEVQQLPIIVMRRRNLRHTFLAAYALMYKHRLQNEMKRAIFYGQVALDASNDANEPLWKLGALNDLGIVYETDSQFEKAIDCFEKALEINRFLNTGAERHFNEAAIVGNLGYNKLQIGKTIEGVTLILRVIDSLEGASTLSDANIDLCYGHLELGDCDAARKYGEKGLELAVEPRQIRNAHYLLGEVAYKLGDLDAAHFHFDELARYYPQFRNLKSVLFAIDLRSMVNFRL